MKLSEGFERSLRKDIREELSKLLDEIREHGTYSEYMTIKETAGYVNVSRSTIDNWIKKKGLPTISVGGTTRIKRSNLDEYLNNFNTN